jgi:hypothetical protein
MSDDKLLKWVKPLLEFGPIVAFFIAYTQMKDNSYTIAGSDYQGFIVVTLFQYFWPRLFFCGCSLEKYRQCKLLL